MKRRNRRIAAAVSPVEAMEPRMLLSDTPLGDEFRVNETTAGDQYSMYQPVAMSDAGRFAAVWISPSGDKKNPGGIFGRVYDESGNPGTQFRISSSTEDSPVVSMDTASGQFAVAWTEAESVKGSKRYFLRIQRFGVTGTPLGSAITLRGQTSLSQPRIAMAPGGAFVLSWQQDAGYQPAGDGNSYRAYTLHAQRFNTDGTAAGANFQVAPQYLRGPNTGQGQNRHQIALDPSDGDLTVVWYGEVNTASGTEDVFARRFDAGNNGSPEFLVHPEYAADRQILPRVTYDRSGASVIAWSSYGQDGSGWGAYAKRYDAGGAETASVQVSPVSEADQMAGGLAAGQDGSFVITWGQRDATAYEVFAQRFDATAGRMGLAFQLNQYTDGEQSSPGIAMAADGDFVAVWRSVGQDGSGSGLYGRRYQYTPSEQPASIFSAGSTSTSSEASDDLTAGSDPSLDELLA